MVIEQISTDNFISDTTLYVRDDLRANITDPISGIRPAGQQFIYTNRPQNGSTHPLMIVKVENPSDIRSLGQRSSLKWLVMTVRVLIETQSQTQKDKLTQDVINRLRSIQFTATGTVYAKLNDHSLISAIDNDDDGDGGVARKIIRFQYKFILGQ